MILVDTSVWIAHLRHGSPRLAALLGSGEVLCHPFVIGELACGRLTRRAEVLSLLSQLPQAPVADHEEVLSFLESRSVFGHRIGWVDAHLLASSALCGGSLWTLDRRLAAVARALGLASRP